MTDRLSKESILNALKGVKGPDLEDNIVDLGLVSEIVIGNGKVYFSISVPAEKAEELEPLREAAEKVVTELEGVSSVGVTLTAESDRKNASGANGQSKNGEGKNGEGIQNNARTSQSQQSSPNDIGIPGVNAIIAVASGKGGVGKSTTSINLALGFKAKGLKVGILDADIYGPSMPRLLGISGKPEATQDNKLAPMEAYGLKVMSMGFIVEEDTPMIWRGPMVMQALTQMLREVEWGELDILVVDMPPGTGDAQLTMAQQVPLAGAVIISTPQDLALIDARRGLNMFRKVDVPVLGLIENMSYFLCPNCGERSEIFGHGGAKIEADKLSLPFLGEIPLHMDIRSKSDIGQPIVATEPEDQLSKVYIEIAGQLWSMLEGGQGKGEPSAPNIVFEN